MTKTQFWTLCRQHDWYYDYSDDHRFWQRGVETEAVIQQALVEQPELRPIYQGFIDWLNGSIPHGEQPPCPKD